MCCYYDGGPASFCYLNHVVPNTVSGNAVYVELVIFGSNVFSHQVGLREKLIQLWTIVDNPMTFFDGKYLKNCK